MVCINARDAAYLLAANLHLLQEQRQRREVLSKFLVDLETAHYQHTESALSYVGIGGWRCSSFLNSCHSTLVGISLATFLRLVLHRDHSHDELGAPIIPNAIFSQFWITEFAAQKADWELQKGSI